MWGEIGYNRGVKKLHRHSQYEQVPAREIAGVQRHMPSFRVDGKILRRGTLSSSESEEKSFSMQEFILAGCIPH